MNDSFILESGYHKDKQRLYISIFVVIHVLRVLVENITCLIKATLLDCLLDVLQ